MITMTLDAPDILLLEALALFALWLYVAWLLRSEVNEPGEPGPRPIVGFVIASSTLAFGLQVVTAVIPALGNDLAIISENREVIHLIVGMMRGAAFVLLAAYILYRRQEDKQHG